MTQSYTDPMTRDYWRRVRAALEFLEGIPTEELEGRKLRDVLEQEPTRHAPPTPRNPTP